MPRWQEPDFPAKTTKPLLSGRGGAEGARVSSLALLIAAGVLLSGCSSTSDPQAKLCTSSFGQQLDTACEGPSRAISLTLPRSELLKKVEVPADTDSQSPVVALPPAPGSAGSGSAGSGSEKLPDLKTADKAVDARPADPRSVSPLRRLMSALSAASETPADPMATGTVDKTETDKGEKDGAPAPFQPEPPAADKPQAASAPLEAEKPSPRAKASAVSQRSAAERSDRGLTVFSGPLSDAIRRAVGDHPLIGLAGARVSEALAGIGIAESAFLPQVEGRLGAGPGGAAAFSDSDVRGYWAQKNAYGSARGEASVSGRQLLFDFGAVKNDVAKSSAMYDSEALKLREQTEAISGQVSDIFLKILEQRELLIAATENVTALEKIVKLVEENEKNGNGTVADMKRVRSRLIDSQTAVADAKSELQTGSDRFARLVHATPGSLRGTPFTPSTIPRTPDVVIRSVIQGNPRIQALEASLRAAKHEIEAQKASVLPKLALETDLSVKEYRTLKDKTEVDAKGMLVMKYKFLDGGLHSNQLEQLNSRYIQAEMRIRSESDDIEADIRKQYRTLNTVRAKSESLKDNVATSLKARQLYDEQFRGGKRTLLELLDIQTTYYTTRRTEITNKFEEQRAVFAVLMAMGRLTPTLMAGRPVVARVK